jgi:P-type E1-E2 ATPase
MDPIKPNVVESISICKEAGIKVIMCTGDNLDTAKAIAINAGIIS